MAQLISIGNSKGIRLPKTIIQQAHLEDKELTFKVLADGVLISPVKNPREGWQEAFSKMAAQPVSKEEEEWLNADLVSNQLETEWEW